MRFLFCCEFYYPSVGGVQEVMRQIAERMVRRGHHVTVATTQIAGSVKEWNGVTIEHFAVAGNEARGMVGEIERYRSFVADFPADAILIKAAQQWTFDALFPVFDTLKARKIFIPCGFSGLYEPLYADYFKRLPDILRQCDELIFYAKKYRDIDFCRDHGLQNLRFVPNGASESEFRTSIASPTFRHKFNIPDDAFIFSTVGNLSGVKGHREVAEAFALMPSSDKMVTLVLNGNTPNSSVAGQVNVLGHCHAFWRRGCMALRQHGPMALARRAAARMKGRLKKGNGKESIDALIARINAMPNKQAMLVDLPRPDVIDLFKNTNLFVFASRIEYSPLVLFEAAAAGTPFLTVPVGNAAEIAAMTGAGILCDAATDLFGYMHVPPQKLADAMQSAMQDPALLKNLGDAGRRNWLEKFTWDRIATHYEILLTGRTHEEEANRAKPIVSVVMPVLNGAAYVLEAINSILAQTFTDFEIIIVDDGSSDMTAALVKSVADSRIRLFSRSHEGLSGAPNFGVAQARGKYIARHDHDDISLPLRLEKQVAFLEANPDYALVGTRAKIWVEDRPSNRSHDHACTNAELQFPMLFNNYIVHSSVMIRRDVFLEFGGYTLDKNRYPPEDYELWLRIMRKYKIANLAEPLMIYREVAGSICRTISFENTLIMLCAENMAYAVGAAEPNQDMRDIAALVHRTPALASPRPDYLRMNRIIRQAAASIDRAHPGANAALQGEELIERLRWRPLLAYYEGLPLWLRKTIKNIRFIIVWLMPWLRPLKRWTLIAWGYFKPAEEQP